jgi:hypothetical protein
MENPPESANRPNPVQLKPVPQMREASRKHPAAPLPAYFYLKNSIAKQTAKEPFNCQPDTFLQGFT